ncbi:MAG: hypothetical protein R3D55_22395 [Chloroflexota bacterium]
MLKPTHKKLFIRDFQSGFDSVMRQFSLSLHDLFSPVELILSVHDRDAHDGWSNLRLRFYEIETLAIHGDPKTFQVLSSGFSFDWFSNDRFKKHLYLSFDLYPNKNHTREDYMASGFLVISKRCYWERLPYAENFIKDASEAFIDTEAVVIDCGASREGVNKAADSDDFSHYWVYEYEYFVPGSDQVMKHQDKIEFFASAYGRWLSKYPKGFRFPVRFNRNLPTQHKRLHEFD